MTKSEQGVASIWPRDGVLIGMIHLPPLPGTPRWSGSMATVRDHALRDAEALTESGFDGIIVENYGDAPFLPAVSPECMAALTVAVDAVGRATALPLGVNVLRNDAVSALAIARATDAAFIRVNVHTGSMWTDQGLIEGTAGETLRTRSRLQLETRILADVHVKHGIPPAGSSVTGAASDAWDRGLADGLIVSGTATGRPVASADLDAARKGAPEAPLFVGSGVTETSVRGLLTEAFGCIIGSAIMSAGPGTPVDPSRAKRMVEVARG